MISRVSVNIYQGQPQFTVYQNVMSAHGKEDVFSESGAVPILYSKSILNYFSCNLDIIEYLRRQLQLNHIAEN